MNTTQATEINLQMPCFSRPLASDEKTIRLFWRTESGSGNTLLYVKATNYTDAMAIARSHFRQFFTGYTLIGTSIA